MVDKLTARIALLYLNRFRARQAEYLEAQAEANAKGWRTEYCIHGTYMWADYDAICGGCEEGEFTEYTRGTDLMRVALDAAKRRRVGMSEEFRERAHHAKRLRDCGVDFFESIVLSEKMRPVWIVSI